MALTSLQLRINLILIKTTDLSLINLIQQRYKKLIPKKKENKNVQCSKYARVKLSGVYK